MPSIWDLSSSEDELQAQAPEAADVAASPVVVRNKGGRPRKVSLTTVLVAREKACDEAGLVESAACSIVPAVPGSRKAVLGSDLEERLSKLLSAIGPATPSILFSATALASFLDCDRRQVPTDLVVLAELVCRAESASLATLHQYVLALTNQNRVKPISMIVWRKYDETPCRLAVECGTPGESCTEPKVCLRDVS